MARSGRFNHLHVMLGASPPLVVRLDLPLPGDDPKQRKPDITKARKYLQWEPKVPLEKGLDHAIKYFRELDLGRFKKPTKHTAHLNTEALEGDKKRQKTA